MEFNVRRNTLLILSASLLFSCVIQILILSSGLIIKDLTGSLVLASLASSIIFGGDIVVVYHAGLLADRIGRKKVLLIAVSLALFALIQISLAFLQYNLMLFWSGLVFFSFSGGFFVQNRTAITDIFPFNKRSRATGYLCLASLAGSLLSSLIVVVTGSVTIIAGFSQYAILVIISILLLSIDLFLIKMINPDPKDFQAYFAAENAGDLKNGSFMAEGDRYLRKTRSANSSLIAVFAASSLGVGIMAIAFSAIPLVLKEANVSLSLISIALSVLNFGSNGFAVLFGWIADRTKKKITIMIGGLLMGFGAALISITVDFLIMSFAALLIGAGASMITVGSTALIANLTHVNQRGRAFGANSFLANVASLLFPPIGIILLSTNPIYFSITLSLVGLLILLICNQIKQNV